MFENEKLTKRRRVRKYAIVSGVILLLIISLYGAISYNAVSCHRGSAEREPILSVRQAVNIFAKEDIPLSKTTNPEAEEINGVKPIAFFINDIQHELGIYPYCSTQTVLDKLNDTQEIIFTGSGENWEATTLVQCEYYYKDEGAAINCENYYIESFSLKYLGTDIESVGTISYKIQHSSRISSGLGYTLNSNGRVNLGSIGGVGVFPSADEEIIFTIRWNNQEETFAIRSE